MKTMFNVKNRKVKKVFSVQCLRLAQFAFFFFNKRRRFKEVQKQEKKIRC